MLDSSLLTDFRITCLERNLGVHGIHVYQQGVGEVANYRQADDRAELWSASKTYTSLAIGMCVAEGRLSLTDPVLDFFPEYAGTAAPGSEAIRVVDLLQMRSGKDFEDLPEATPDEVGHADWAELYFRAPQDAPAGSHFFYANGSTYMLSRLVEKTSGSVLLDYLVPRLFQPLDIINPWWNACPQGHSFGCYGLQLTLTEFAKLGRLLLQNGAWGDHQLVPASYVEAMHTDVVPPARHFDGDEWNVGYGYQVWLNRWPGSYRADGKYGQHCIVMPDRQATITVVSHDETNTAGILAAIFNDIAPKL
ncbi:MAG: beta-lactamase family protein [Propionibacteriaceae bacterium]|nr:beta-lactamase family protein [Propionibacteriaceae bacterium]